MVAGHVFRGWSILLFWWGCLANLYSNNSKSNSWNDLVDVVKDKDWLSVTGPGVVPSIIQFRHQGRKQRGSLYLYTRVSYDVNGTSTFHVSRLPLCGDVAINPGPLKPKAPKFSCKEAVRQYEGVRTQDAILRAECSGWSHARVKVFVPVQSWFPVAILVTKHSHWTCGLCSLPKITAECYQQSSYADSDSPDANNQNETWNEFDTGLLKRRTNVKIGHVNGNFIAGIKFHENKTWLLDGRFDILVFSETKIDSTFPDSQFHIFRFRMCRADRTKGGGGLRLFPCFSVRTL